MDSDVCAKVGGTYISVTVSVLNVPGGSSFTDPCRNGITGANMYTNDPDIDPWFAPLPAITRSL